MQEKLINYTKEAFQTAFGSDAERIFLAPGRINIIGEHVDYSDGFVLPAAIDKHICFAVKKRMILKSLFLPKISTILSVLMLTKNSFRFHRPGSIICWAFSMSFRNWEKKSEVCRLLSAARFRWVPVYHHRQLWNVDLLIFSTKFSIYI